MNERYRIEAQDYIEFLNSLEPESVDLVCIDPPYGKNKSLVLYGQKRTMDWDRIIDWTQMFSALKRVLKKGGTICAFGQNPTYAQMLLSNVKDFKYELIWYKNKSAQGFHADKMPLSFSENIAIFINEESKNHKRTFNNVAKEVQIDRNEHYVRWYAQQIQGYIGLKRRQIHNILGHRKLEFFFCYTGTQFNMISAELYQALIDNFQINKYENFVSFEELKDRWNQEKHSTKGVKLDSEKYSKTLTNIIEAKKEKTYYHPTQKPVELMKKLIGMYSNENDVVLDCFMGSGSTGVAALELGRKFLGCEIDFEYFNITKTRLEETLLSVRDQNMSLLDNEE
ncbi:site-specific DNA-methyltransferase [Mycoplasma sp. Ms02]|uniref:DNA-methyltransferase n=1 Tax=Mycoplasma sp. Ms02 TaxID=353851 RepID=UPI001C8A8675|nr:site-specific DNA-methyltransferase [Mycoplasma sp. Ms02]QZE12386.1 site-specific DNA-methyltransferase [Mycoplasma sp. Ms02]